MVGMLKINKNEMINEDMIEAVTFYGSSPLKRFAGSAQDPETVRRLKGRYGLKSMVVMQDGFVFLCPFNANIYLARLPADDYILLDPKKGALRASMVREVTTKLTAEQRREIIKKKQERLYIDLTCGKKTKYYFFMASGRVYGTNIFRGQQGES